MEMINKRGFLIKQYNKKLKSVNWQKTTCIFASTKSLRIYKKDRYGIINPVCICLNCGTFRANPIPPEDINNDFYASDLYQEIYSGEYLENHFRKRIKAKEINNIYQILKPFLKKEKDSKIVEIGCGGGWNLEPFQREGFKNLIGYKPGQESREIGIRELGLDLREGFISDVINTGEKYDLIILNHLIEHLYDPIKILKELKSILQDDGIIYLGLPNMQYLGHGQIQNAHIWYFPPLTFMKVIIASNLQLCDFGNDRHHFYCIAKKSNKEIFNGNFIEKSKIINYERNMLFIKLLPYFFIDILKKILRPLKVFLKH